MAPMQPMSKSARARSGPTDEFVELCKTLYGDAVDPGVVWGDVIKLSPDQADLHAQRNAKIRRNVERGSNAVGITAGTLGLGAALKDERLDPEKNPSVGRVGRALHRTGQKMPRVLGRIQNKKVQAGLAAAAVGTQMANLGGDALIAGTLGKKPAKARGRKSDYALAKRANPAGIPKDLRPQVQGLRKLWKTPAGNTLAPTGGVAKRGINPRGTLNAVARPRAIAGARRPPPVVPEPPSAEEAARAAARARRGDRYQQRQALYADAKSMLGTKSGKVATGGAALLGARELNKSADPDVEFRGEFSKFDDEKMQAFGWASVVKIDGQDVVDKQGDYISLEDLEDAAYQYVHKSRVGGDMHRRNGDAPHHVSDMIESMVFTDEKIAKMNLPDDFPRGWWVGYQIHDPDTWAEVRKKGRTGFSIHGKGLRRDYEMAG